MPPLHWKATERGVRHLMKRRVYLPVSNANTGLPQMSQQQRSFYAGNVGSQFYRRGIF